MEKEYIEREAVLKISPFTKYGGDTSQYTEGFLDCAEQAREAIRNAPTADVVEVRHGKWYLLDECANEGVYCSICRKKVYRTEYANQKVKSNYCPNCGAKMDGGNK